MKFYEKIKNRREELNMSQDELAKLMGYKSRSSINKIELGHNDIPQSKLEAFAKVLKVTPEYLLGWDEPLPTTDNNYSDDEKQIIICYRSLNDSGKKKFFEYMEDLTDLNKYKKNYSHNGSNSKETKFA